MGDKSPHVFGGWPEALIFERVGSAGGTQTARTSNILTRWRE